MAIGIDLSSLTNFKFPGGIGETTPTEGESAKTVLPTTSTLLQPATTTPTTTTQPTGIQTTEDMRKYIGAVGGAGLDTLKGTTSGTFGGTPVIGTPQQVVKAVGDVTDSLTGMRPTMESAVVTSSNREEHTGPKVTPTKTKAVDVTPDVEQQNVVEAVRGGEKQSANFEELNKIVMDYAKGNVADPVFNKALNNYIANISLYNQADMEALSQQIAQDPDLRGTGLGYALLAQAGREAGFRVSDMLGKLSTESAQRLMDMQKFGINTALEMDNIRRSRADADIQTMMNTGNFAGAANLLNKRFAGSGVVIDPNDLAARDQFTLEQFDTQMADISTRAKNDPEGAAAMLQTLMDDPRYSGWFAPGMTAQAMVQSIVDGTFEANRQTNLVTRQEINTIAASDSATFDSVNSHYDDLSRNGWRDTFVKIGEKMSFDEVNELREMNNDTLLTQDEYDDFRVDPDQLEEWGQMDDFYRIRGSQESIWDATLNALKQSPMIEDLLKSDTNGDLLQGMELWVSSLLTGGGSYDPVTGFDMPTDMSGFISDPANYHFFMDWPMAAFDAEGNVENPNNVYWGNRVFTSDMKTANPEKVAVDSEVDKKWVDYRAAGGQLSGPEWYFASAGGKYGINDPGFNEERIPENAKNMVGDGSVTLPEVPETPEVPGITEEPPSFEDLSSSLADKVRIGDFENVTAEEILTLPSRLPQKGDDSTNGIPTGTGVVNWKTQNATTGGYINVQGVPLRVINGGTAKGDTDFVHLETLDGQKWTFNENGQWYSGWVTPIPDPLRGLIFPTADGMNFETFRAQFDTIKETMES